MLGFQRRRLQEVARWQTKLRLRSCRLLGPRAREGRIQHLNTKTTPVEGAVRNKRLVEWNSGTTLSTYKEPNRCRARSTDCSGHCNPRSTAVKFSHLEPLMNNLAGRFIQSCHLPPPASRARLLPPELQTETKTKRIFDGPRINFK